MKVLSKTRSPIIFITKRILRQESSAAVTKSSNVSVCFHTKSVDFVCYSGEREEYPI